MKVALAKTFHLNVKIVSGPPSRIAPEMKIKSESGEEPFLLGFIEETPEGGQEAHFFVLDEDGKQNVVRHLSGGLVPVGVEELAKLPKMAVPRSR